MAVEGNGRARTPSRSSARGMRPIRVSFSMFCADFKNLGAVIRSLETGGVDELHFDVVDGRFARIISIGPQVLPKIHALRELAEKKGLVLDIEVDGNINRQTMPAVAGAGANVYVLGTSCGILKDLSRAKETIEEIRGLARKAIGQESRRRSKQSNL